DGFVVAARAQSAFAHLDDELPLAHADPLKLRCDGLGERLMSGTTRSPELVCKAVYACLGGRQRRRCRRGRVEPLLDRVQLGTRLGGPGEQLLVRLATEAAPCLGDPVELAFDELQAPRIGLERGGEAAQPARRLAQAQLDVS